MRRLPDASLHAPHAHCAHDLAVHSLNHTGYGPSFGGPSEAHITYARPGVSHPRAAPPAPAPACTQADVGHADALCPHCPCLVPEGYPIDLEPLWLHARRYALPGEWAFEAELPAWAADEFVAVPSMMPADPVQAV